MPYKVKIPALIRTDSLDKLGESVVNLSKWAEDELNAVASNLQDTEPDFIWYRVPPKPQRGTYAYADGTTWNPGYGEGAYTYNGSLWVPTRGDLLWNSSLNMTAAQRAQALTNLGASAKWNRFINGALQISQENGTTALTAAGAYTADGWNVGWSTGSYTHQLVGSPTPGGGPYRLRITVTSGPGSVGAGDYLIAQQSIEGTRVADFRMGSSAAKTITIRFGVKCPVAGTYSVAIRNSGSTRSYATTYTIAAGEVNQDVIKSVTVPLDQAGTWATDNSVGMTVSFTIYSGSTYTTAANTWTAGNFINASGAGVNLVNGSVWEFFEPRLDEGTVVQPFQMPDYASEMRLAQRYWQKLELQLFGGYIAAAGAPLYTTWIFTTEMRTTPTIATIIAAGLQNCSFSIGSSGQVTNKSARVDVISTAAGTAYAQGGVYSLNARI